MEIRDLQTALGTSSKVQIDECDDPCIYGKNCKIYVDGDGSYGPSWYIYIPERRSWEQTKQKLNFMVLWQDGEYEGVHKLDRFPTSKESSIIRRIGGLRKKKELSPEHKQKLIESGQKFRLANECT